MTKVIIPGSSPAPPRKNGEKKELDLWAPTALN